MSTDDELTIASLRWGLDRAERLALDLVEKIEVMARSSKFYPVDESTFDIGAELRSDVKKLKLRRPDLVKAIDAERARRNDELKRRAWGRELTYMRFKVDIGIASERERRFVEEQRCAEWDNVLPLYDEVKP